MGRPGKVVHGTAQPQARRSDSRESGDGRLDPVRWRRPGRGLLTRLAAVAILLVTAAVVSWSPPAECTPPTGAAAVPPKSAAAASPTPKSSAADPPGSPPADPAEPTGTIGQAAPTEAAQGPSPGEIPADSVGVPIRLADPTALALVSPGNRIDLLRVNNANDSTTPVATDVLVLNVTDSSDPTTGGLLLALTRDEASQAVATPNQGFAILIRPD